MRIKKRRIGEALFGYSLALPALLAVGVILFWPIVHTLRLSFYDVNLIKGMTRFVAFRNFISLVKSADFRLAIGRTAYFSLVSILIELVLAYLIANLLNKNFRGRGILRTIVILPWAIPTVVNGVIWKWIYNPSFGALNGLLYQFGFIKEYIPWLTDPFRAMNMVILADVWKMTPFCAILMLAALQTVPRDIVEAAKVDGAGVVRVHFNIILPFLKPMILVILVIRTIDTFRAFDIIYVLTRGGPAGGTTVLGYLVYKEAFEFLRFGSASAISVVIALFVGVLAMVYYKSLHTQEVQQ